MNRAIVMMIVSLFVVMVGCGQESQPSPATTTTTALPTTTTVTTTTTSDTSGSTSTTTTGASTTSDTGTTTTTSGSTSSTNAKETSFEGLTLGWHTAEVVNAWGDPATSQTVGDYLYYNWNAISLSKEALFLDSNKELVRIGVAGSGKTLRGITYLDQSSVVTAAFGTPEATSEAGTAVIWVYNSRNLGYAISNSTHRVITLYVLDGDLPW